MSARSKASTEHEAPERAPRQGAAPQPGAVTRDGIELLLKQFVERLGDDDASAGVHQLQRQVSALAKSYGADTGEFDEEVQSNGKARPHAPGPFPDEVRDAFLANARGWDYDEDEQTARELAPERFLKTERFPEKRGPALGQEARLDENLEHFFGSPDADRALERFPEKRAAASRPDARPDKQPTGNLWQRDWFEHRFSELKSLIASTGSLDAAERLNAVEQRLEEISDRLDAMRKSPAQTEALQLVERQMRILANHLAHSKDWQQSAQQSLGTLNAKVDTLGQMTSRTTSMIAENGKRAEAAIFVAVEKGAQRASDLTARRFSEGLQQALPAARFAVIEQEIRALSQHARESGQRSTKAMEDVQQALRQVLRQKTPAANGARGAQQSAKRAGIGDPIQMSAPKAARPAVQRPRWPESGIPAETISHTGWNTASPPSAAADHEFAGESRTDARPPHPAPLDRQPETRQPAEAESAWRPLDSALAKLQSAPPAAEPARHPAPSFEFAASQGPYGEYPEDGRQLKYGLIVAAIILLLASAGMLYLNLTAKKNAVQARPAATSMEEAPASAMAFANVVEVVGLDWPNIAVSPATPVLRINLGRGKAGAHMTTIFKTPAATVRRRMDEARAQTFIRLKNQARQKDPVAQYRLAVSYERGRGVAKDLALAELWYTRAAARGNVLAMYNLGSLHTAKGAKSHPRNYRQAVTWFRKAAGYGLTDSEFNLGLILEKGIGVAANRVEAYKWYSLAAAAGDREAGRRGAALRLRLSPAQIRRAERLIAAWKPLPWPAKANPSSAQSDQV